MLEREDVNGSGEERDSLGLWLGGLGRFCGKKGIVSFCGCLLFVCMLVVSNEITGREECNFF